MLFIFVIKRVKYTTYSMGFKEKEKWNFYDFLLS